MPAPLAVELRQRVVDAYENGEGSYTEIAERFGVGEASVSRWLRLARFTGGVEPKPAGGDRRSKLGDEGRKLLASLVEDEPNWTTTELAQEVSETLGISVSRKAVGRALRKMGYTFKRGSSVRQPPSRPTQ